MTLTICHKVESIGNVVRKSYKTPDSSYRISMKVRLSYVRVTKISSKIIYIWLINVIVKFFITVFGCKWMTGELCLSNFKVDCHNDYQISFTIESDLDWSTWREKNQFETLWKCDLFKIYLYIKYYSCTNCYNNYNVHLKGYTSK